MVYFINIPIIIDQLVKVTHLDYKMNFDNTTPTMNNEIDGVTQSLAQMSLSDEPKKVHASNVVIAIDTSGSMRPYLRKGIENFNSEILSSQQNTYKDAVDIKGIALPGELCLMTLIFFSGNQNIQIVFQDMPVQDVLPINPDLYRADGMTALRDTIVLCDNLKFKYPERKTMRFFITDGEDTDSNAKHQQVKEIFAKYEKSKIENPDCAHSATFIGSNQDAVSQGTSMGLHTSSALTYDDDNIGDAMTSVGRMLSRVATGVDQSPMVYEQDRIDSCPKSYHSTPNDYDVITTTDM
jgi:hypothetical protein